MKRSFFAAALIAALAVSGVPMTSHAAEINMLKKGNGYVVYSLQGKECLQQAIQDICDTLGGNGGVLPEQPDTEQPDTETPDIETPDTEQPDTEMPEQPDTETPEQPDTGLPEQPEIKDPQEPEQPGDSETDSEGSENLHHYAEQVLRLVNEERKKAGLAELKWDAKAAAAANVRAREIRQNFSHTRPNGSSFSTALTEQGVSFRRSGENIAWGQKTPKQVMNAWMNSDGHRANILSRNYENIGIGYYQDENGVNYWVQLFTA